ncbi:glucosamine 6-phosphate N-acetyltransferase-like isoform X2 [Corticium candelabrum]|uniref:glucosamine 6-phosphate N-acetyltransferase-like isoform X2 n=1 Tax=Corticium candelabrum TaxID=121492 RepID=UPI002E2684FD|nr:glucosamine 6-phosphate N-acetyltransferase-like isoform X2 [Corticium candelabrum]
MKEIQRVFEWFLSQYCFMVKTINDCVIQQTGMLFIQFDDQFGAMKKAANHFVVVIEDVTVGKIISSATLLIEHKFIHRASQRGRVEDVVVHEGHRGKQLAKLMLESLRLLSIELGCYKLTLECDEKMRPFYEKFGFKLGSTLFLQLRFFE